MGKWGKWVVLTVLAFFIGSSAYAVDLKLSGKYEIQGRLYSNAEAKVASDKDNNNPYNTTSAYDFWYKKPSPTIAYFKHYFYLYPELAVNENISVKSSLCAFKNVISKDDTEQWYGYGRAKNPNYDRYNVFTIDELYADAKTPIGLFRAGKTADFNGLGWFIKGDFAPGWMFGLVWNKKQDGTKIWALDRAAQNYTTSAVKTFDNTHDTADQNEFYGLINYADKAIDFKGNLSYRQSGADAAQTSIFYPHFYLNYAVSDSLKFNSKLGWGTGAFIKESSPVAKYLTGVLNTALSGLTAYNGFQKNWKVSNAFGAWVGANYKFDPAAVQVDFAYLTGAKNPNEVSAYLDDKEDMGTWLMKDVRQYYANIIDTYPTIAALGDPITEGQYSYANAILIRGNISTKFTDKFSGSLNVCWSMLQNDNYLKNWTTITTVNSTTDGVIRLWNAVDPDYMKLDASEQNKVNKNMGVEARVILNYAWQPNLNLALDLAYYKVGAFYKDMIQNAFLSTDVDTKWKLKDTGAVRWIATVKF